MIREYNKLIRDRIPEIIKKAGEKPLVRVLEDDVEYHKELMGKVMEEARELYVAWARREGFVSELVDIQELIDTILAEMGISQLEFMELQRKKRVKRGGFKKRLFLIKTEAGPRSA